MNAGVASVMCSYNEINGYQACGNATTLTEILRNELGFKGFVTSDWGANHGTTYLDAGLDMEMPGGGGPSGTSLPSYFSKDALKAAIASGAVQEKPSRRRPDGSSMRWTASGCSAATPSIRSRPEPTRSDERVVRRTARDAATLLKNSGAALPLSHQSLANLALIGPGAGQTIATNSGGEAAGGLLSQQPSALQTLQQATRHSGANITYAVADDLTGNPVPASMLSHAGQPGLLRTDTATGATHVDSQLNATISNGNALPVGATDMWTGP